MNCKGFLVACLATTLGVCALCAGTIYTLDPYFRYQSIDPEGELWFDERYQVAGILHDQTYETVLMGTSLAANYRPSWFNEVFDTTTVKVTFPSGGLGEFDTALTYAMGEQEVKRVIMGLDANILARDPQEEPDELPVFLYNNNILDDGPYLLNKETLGKSLYLATPGQQAGKEPLDAAYLWDTEQYIFSQEQAIASYPRPSTISPTQPDDYYAEHCAENLGVVLNWVETYPDTDFIFYFSPYSMLFWDKMDREGTTEAMLTMLETAIAQLTAYPNVTVQFFMNDFSLIEDLDNYTDHIHASGAVTKWLAQAMGRSDYVLTAENHAWSIDQFRQALVGYEYEGLFVIE